MPMLQTRSFLIAILFSVSLLQLNSPLHAAVVARSYPMGEGDNGAAIGDEAFFTADTVESDLDQVDVLVDLDGFGTYVAGRNEDSEFAISFSGDGDFFQAFAFDPRHFGGSFTALSQGWIKPSSDGEGFQQTVWGLGTDNGGVGITEDGFWQLNSGGSAGSLVSETPVAFDEWVHLAVLRGGNNGTLYMNGSVIARNDGFWNAPGEFYLGIGPLEEDPFFGTIDDFAISGFQDGSFDPAIDIMFLDPESLTGILGDVDQDGLVGQADYDAWSSNVGFNNGLGVGDFGTLFRGDVDQNGIVNFFDFQIIRTEAMAAGNAIAVPEPTSHLLFAIATLALLTLRRRRI